MTPVDAPGSMTSEPALAHERVELQPQVLWQRNQSRALLLDEQERFEAEHISRSELVELDDRVCGLCAAF